MADFMDFLQHARNEDLRLELDEQLAALTQAVTQHEKPGTITLTLKVVPSDEMGRVIVIDDVKAKLPVAGRSGKFYFVTEDFGLSRSNPAQMTLPEDLPAIGEAAGEIPNTD